MALSPATFTGAGWIPIGTDPNVIQQMKQASFLEQFGMQVPMTTRTKYTPRSGGVVMARKAKGQPYAKDSTSVHDSVLLTYDTFGGMVDIEEEDQTDTSVDMVSTLSFDAAASYGRLVDNVAFGITAAAGTSGWNFDSLYYLLTQSDSFSGYTANSNIVTAATAGKPTYDDFSNALSKLEGTKWYNPNDIVVGAHPAFKAMFRGVKDSTGRPIIIESSGGFPGGAAESGDSIFGYPARYSLGLAQSAAGSEFPTGRPLMVFAVRSLIKRGDRRNLEAHYADANSSGYGFDSDVNGLKFRADKAFAPGAIPGFSILVG